MKKLLMASVAIVALGFTAPAFAQTQEDGAAVVGGGAGGAAGATAGFLLGGPVGALIGGFAGAVIGAEATVAATSVEFAATNPVEPVYIEGAVDVGYAVPADYTVYPIEGDEQYGYFYANDRVWIVDLESRTLVQSPGLLVNQTAADYAVANPVTSVTIDGELTTGYVVPGDVELVQVPDSATYSYVYINDRPVLVENASRTVVYVN